MEPLRHSEVVRFQNGRTMIGKYLALGEHKLDATPGQALDLKALAKTLDERFPFLVGKENGAPGNMFSHESYLKYLKQYQLMLDDDNAAKKGWAFEVQAEKLADHDQTVAEISKSLKEMQEPGIKESFQKQSDQIITRISKATGGKIKNADLERYFSNIFKVGDSERLTNLEKLASAREVQLGKKLPTDPRVMALEHVFQNLPANLDLKEVIFRYAMIEGFENMMKDMHLLPELEKSLQAQAQTRIATVLKSSSPNSKGESLFKIAARGDQEWLENAFMKFYGITTSPKEVFYRLQKLPRLEEKINYAINRNFESLKFIKNDELELLRQTTSRESFNQQMRLIEMNINKPENPERVANLQALKNLRKESVKSYKFNIPFFQELKDKGIINEEWVVSAKGNLKLDWRCILISYQKQQKNKY
ncbi:uncharacterized protein PGTG_14064 [Puccinia graminis f. sp. tritici CRL 75-36-700-3]|uniref:Uncharacterized protein n=1 Tax=Puccinia graminis f. sp. tritici (strain CRL 75-36-700-3 / race SCCL) TaxID=418459 RepID=E3KW11_PUCGT|nr:uncharacterized protein PGTG_14064 [Puccinia graminis f. sp. tritici CRL 75-36-700-3]EFP88486.2 hypothetical protein PGTG_14064 [Puccinia graminis f. sp. tritici CRL 75-36-700-3]